ncbi:MAG: decarboxylating 6-phosphogluconate dehydrogenase [Halanaerobiales bacterium]|nr:decarboxylating 6-phosphogluconate dehydrogenase [Halanaerobiales bacterium]
MKIGMVGLGKMGGNMTEKLLKNNHEIVVFDVNHKKVEEYKNIGAIPSTSLQHLVNKLDDNKKVVWVMVPAGEIVNKTVIELANYLDKGDIIIDGGNSNYKDSIKLGEKLKQKGIDFLDIGTSGGVWGLEEGYCLMVGGPKRAYETVREVLKDLAPQDGYNYIGKSGAGHFVKMVHNGIEYAMMESYAEGFEILKSKDEFDIDLGELADLWNHGGVIRSWLLELTADSLKENPELEGIKDYVEDSGEGRWTVLESIEQEVPASVIALSLFKRYRSRQDESFSAKILSAMRNAFGGHEIKGE